MPNRGAREQDSARAVEDLLGQVRPDEPVFLLAPAGVRASVPERLRSVLSQAARELERGRDVTVFAADRELTTQQAADPLNVSRPFLVGLLDRGVIPSRNVGTHRRAALADVLAYRERRAAERKVLLDELAAERQASGLYQG
jgi:excisionase family DNA binding protein